MEKSTDYPLVQKTTVGRKNNALPLEHFLKTDTIKAGQTIAFSGDFPIAILGSGNYYLNASLETNKHILIAQGSTFFQRLNMHPAKEEDLHVSDKKTDTAKKTAVSDTGLESVTYFDLDKTFLAKFSLPQIRSILKMLLPVSDPMGIATINNFLKKPDEMYMRYYIYNRFVAINKDNPGKAWKEFSEKIIDVNKRFNFQGTPGYATERGLIYLRYGAPSDVITVNNETGTLPYQIWQYNTLTQMNRKEVADVFFLFYKADQMLGDYRLLHSNVTGEPVNTSWRTYLYTNANTGVNTTTRAEEYIGTK
jgi:GWxTD domain-containing protein